MAELFDLRADRDRPTAAALYYPPDVEREPLTKVPDPLTMLIQGIMKRSGTTSSGG